MIKQYFFIEAEKIVYTTGIKLLKAIAIIVIAKILYEVTMKVFRKIMKGMMIKGIIKKQEMDTFNSLGKNFLKISITIIVFGMIYSLFLGEISIKIVTLGGIIFGIGIQNIIKDIVSGILIILEKQFNVGDCITYKNIEGVVKSIKFRYTKIEDFNGVIHIISNSNLTEISNNSINIIRFTVYISLYNNVSENKTMDKIIEICKDIKEKNKNCEKDFIVNIDSLNNNSTTYKIFGFSKYINCIDIKNELNLRLKREFEKIYIK